MGHVQILFHYRLDILQAIDASRSAWIMLRRLKDSFSCFDGQNGHRGSAEETGFANISSAIINSVSGAIESDRAQAAQERDFCRSGGASTMHSFGAKCSTSYLSSDDNGDESEASLDSGSGDEELSNDESPTWITIDDGKGGLKHVETHFGEAQLPTNNQNTALGSGNGSEKRIRKSHIADKVGVDSQTNKNKGDRRKRKKPSFQGDESSKELPHFGKSFPHSITSLLRRELSGRNFFSMEPQHEAGHSHSRRIVSKKGIVHTERSHVSKRKRRYLSDFFNTMLDLRWRYVLLIFTLSFFLSWFGFSIIWYIIMYLRSDFEPEHLPGSQATSGYIPCVLGIYNFASVFLFSVETQHTIGYGTRQTTERCPEAIFLQSLQSVVGVMIQACMVGTFFAKMSRPKKRAQTLLFTKNAVICKRDGKLCLIFRVGNMRYTSLVEAHIRAVYIGKRVTEEGEVLPYHQRELKVGVDEKGEEDTLLFLWPSSIIHVIDEDSPFYSMSASDFLRKRFEIIVLLEGIVEPTGMSLQARSSYMPNEVLWGYRFLNLFNYRQATNQYKIDYSAFNKVIKVDTPRCSAKELEDESDESDASFAHHSPTSVTVFSSPNTQSSSTSPIDLKARFFQSNTIIPYHQSQAALTPPFFNSPLRGAVGPGTYAESATNRLKSIPTATTTSPSPPKKKLSGNPISSESSHISMPCLHQVKIADSQPNLQAAISAQYKKALGKW